MTNPNDPPDFGVNLTPIVAAMTDVLTEPYQVFITRLLVDGRITEQEVEELRREILDRGVHLADLVQQRLRKSSS